MHTDQQKRFPAVAIVAVLFILCVLPGQSYIAQQFPAISGLIQLNPVLVFLDIPVQLPVAIDLLLTPALFMVSYALVILFYPAGPKRVFFRLRAAFAGFLALMCCMLMGGWVYYLVQDHLSTRVLNGINTLGLNMDIHLPFPDYKTIRLGGSIILFICFITGLWICIRRIRKEPSIQLTREQRMTPYERIMKEKRMIRQVAPSIPSRYCSNQPVVTITPLAVNYMPM
jgi:hypothetical protein